MKKIHALKKEKFISNLTNRIKEKFPESYQSLGCQLLGVPKEYYDRYKELKDRNLLKKLDKHIQNYQKTDFLDPNSFLATEAYKSPTKSQKRQRDPQKNTNKIKKKPKKN
ncbi:hypothetical protein DID75_04430 [Candidatus Marinamargulisbacteria bacterium SCGC AG-410-N11]|nr:hypothetical protein DID75_04430 [Candidatus Marinamargulisbacteria bacterium SCGC AG-410-N11]